MRKNVKVLRGGDQRNGRAVEGSLFRLPLRQPLLTPALRFTLLGFFPDARPFVKSSAFQFAEESFPREFFLGDLEGFFNVIIEDLDFHSFRLSTFPGDACAGFSIDPGWLELGGAV